MAYMRKEHAKEIRDKIKAAFPSKDGWKFSIVNQDHSTISVAIMQSPVKFEQRQNINKYWYKDHLKDNPEQLAVIDKIISIYDEGNHDNSDIMTDYFDVGWYTDVQIGRWDKDCVFI